MIKKLGLHLGYSNDKCVIFPGCKSRRGYGLLRYQNKLQHAHRVSYKILHGEIPNNMCICHTCDNRGCVNPLHLFAASHKENMEDMVKKGRSLKGEKNKTAKLSPEKVIQIRQDTRSNPKIAVDFGVSKNAIHKIKTGKMWGHV